MAVEFEVPGFRDSRLLAVANATGASAPKTNVARSSIEATDERRQITSIVYDVLAESVSTEVQRLRREEAYSLTWAVDQIPFLVGPILNGRSAEITDTEAHQSALSRIPMFLVETGEGRSAKSLAELTELKEFWTIESQLMRSVENFIREARSEVTSKQLLAVSQGTSSPSLDGPIVTNSNRADVLKSAINTAFQVSDIVGRTSDRRLDMKWERGEGAWISQQGLRWDLYKNGHFEAYRAVESLFERSSRRGEANVFASIGNIRSYGLDEYIGVSIYGGIYILPDTAIGELFRKEIPDENDGGSEIVRKIIFMEGVSALALVEERGSVPLLTNAVDRFFKQMDASIPRKWLHGREQFAAAVVSSVGRTRIYDPLGWPQRSAEQ